MEMTIEVPESVVAKAAELKISVEALVLKTLNEFADKPLPSGFVRLGHSKKTPEEATADILDIQSRNTLAGLKIKDLIEEGRRL